MAVISKTAVSLRFFGDDLNPDALTASLGQAPTASTTKGQMITGHKTGITRIAKTGSWRLKVERREPGDLEAQIRELFWCLDRRPGYHVGELRFKPSSQVELWRDLETMVASARSSPL